MELDRDLIPRLEASCKNAGALKLHNVDALRFDFRALAPRSGGMRVVGNLPYNISTPLIFHLLESADVIADMHFMMQKEVVDRITAVAGSRDYGRLSVMVQYRCRCGQEVVLRQLGLLTRGSRDVLVPEVEAGARSRC